MHGLYMVVTMNMHKYRQKFLLYARKCSSKISISCYSCIIHSSYSILLLKLSYSDPGQQKSCPPLYISKTHCFQDNPTHSPSTPVDPALLSQSSPMTVLFLQACQSPAPTTLHRPGRDKQCMKLSDGRLLGYHR